MGRRALLGQLIALTFVFSAGALMLDSAAAQNIKGSEQCPPGEKTFATRAEAAKFLKAYRCNVRGDGTCKGKCVNAGSTLIGFGEGFRATRYCKCATLH